jgi:ABC-type uncharacterized transport system substrate-binding protein
LLHLGIEALVTYGTPATRAAKQATTSVPIVMAISGDAIATGLISRLNRPGGNITGSTFFNPELCAKRLELIKEAVPPTIRVGVLLNPDNPIHLPCLQEMERTAKSINLELEPFQVLSPNEFEGAFLAWDTKHVNAMTVIEDAMLIANSKSIVELMTKRRLPSIAFKEIAEGGGLMAYGVDFAKPFYRAAYFVDKILNGAKSNDLPVEQSLALIGGSTMSALRRLMGVKRKVANGTNSRLLAPKPTLTGSKSRSAAVSCPLLRCAIVSVQSTGGA